MRRRAGVVLALGLVLLALAVGTFIGFTRHFDRTLADGIQTTGTVTQLTEPAPWDPLDSGRITVSFPLRGSHQTARIWLDNDLSGYHVGEQLPLWVRGNHVRTKDDVNGPAPLALSLLIIGLIGLGLALFGGVRLLGRVTSDPYPQAGGMRVPLRAFRLNPRKAHLDLLPTQISLFLPFYFGRRRLEFPLAGAAFAIDGLPTPVDQLHEPEDDEVFFHEAIVIPYFPTASVVRGPNTTILLPEPQRMAPLRRAIMLNQNVDLPFGYRQSHSDKGVWLDGVELAVADPASARLALMNAGLTEADPSHWLAAHRELEQDTDEREAIRADVAHARRFIGIGTLLGGITFISLVGARVTDDFRLAIPGLAALTAQFILPLVARLVRKRRNRGIEEQSA